MKPVLRRPSAELVQAAIDKFDRDNSVIEEALNELFGQYPGNANLPHVLLKVCVPQSPLFNANTRRDGCGEPHT